MVKGTSSYGFLSKRQYKEWLSLKGHIKVKHEATENEAVKR